MDAIGWFRTVLDDLESIDSKHPQRGSHQLWPLKVELGLLRTFYMCGRKFGEWVGCESVLVSIEDALLRSAPGIQSLCLRLKYDELPFDTTWGDLFFVVHEFQRSIDSFPPEINELYLIFTDGSDGSLQTSSSSSSPEDELVDIINSLLDNLRDLKQCRDFRVEFEDPFDALEENLRFLKSFIHLATLRGLEHGQLKDLLAHFEGLVVDTSRLTYMSWFLYDHDSGKFFELLQKFKPVEPHVRQIYVQVLLALKLSESSHLPAPASERSVLSHFVDSLLGNLWERINCGNSYVVSFKDQVQILYEGLRFLRTILRERQDKFDELYEKIHDLVSVVICEAGIVISSLFLKENEECLVEELNRTCSELREKFKLIKAEIGERSSIPSVFSFPRTNMLGIIDAFLEQLKSMSPYQADAVALAKDKFENIQEDLLFFRSFLGNNMVQCDENEKLQELLSRVAGIAHETEFIFDSLVVGDPRHSLIMRLNTIIDEIKLIKTEALETFYSERRHVIEVQKLAKASSKMPLAGSIPVFNELVVGFEDETQKITNRLIRGTKQLDIVSIVGMPGLGKTTLAKKIYNDPSILFHFHVRSWCSISQVYNKKSLLLDILGGIFTNLLDKHLEMNEDDLAEVLYKHLKGKRYLIILNDVWDHDAWNSLGSSFPNDDNGSRILLTSRLHAVALQIKPNSEPHALRLLTKTESWELLQKKICYEEGCPPAIHALGMQIAQNCQGLPLTIVIVAGILSATEQYAWKEVAESLDKSTLSITEQCMNTLELSYRHLPDYLKPCFLYFGAYAEDQLIPIQRLLQLWIAEGLVEKTESKCLEHVAEEYIMDFIRRSLVMVVRRGSLGQVKACIVHDLLHDFCVAKSKEEHFLQLVRGYDELCTFNEPGMLHRLCVYSTREHFAKSRLLCPRVRSLHFLAADRSWYGLDWYNILFIFCLFNLLKVLDLGKISLGFSFPMEIVLLVHLRFLAIRGRMRTIPSSNRQSLKFGDSSIGRTFSSCFAAKYSLEYEETKASMHNRCTGLLGLAKREP